ncbi:ANTAR domain-containing protein [Streptomyces sp. NPDC006134]|uniref:ANTAR domain-containing protein n=1 Tax=Streptomyces sp. NPDC006134 TaxID=3154467 RepID=UPI0033CC9627
MTTATPPRLAGRLTTLMIEARVDAGRALLAPRGELVHGCADTLTETLAGLPAGTGRVDLDMTGVTFMDTAGLQFLDVLHDHGHRHAVTVTTANWNGQPRRILELAGLDTTDPLRSAAHRPPAPRPGPVPSPRPAPAPVPARSAVALERSERLHDLQEEVEQLRHALASRPVIDQARGILMATHGCTSDEAWHLLRETSQLSNTKLRAVAAAITSSAGNGGPPLPGAVRTALRAALARLGR